MTSAGLYVKKNIGMLVAIISISLLSSCMQQPSGYSSRFKSVSSSGWNQHDSLCFDIDTVSNTGRYDFFVEIRNDYTFPYKYLWLSVKTETHHPYSYRCDTLRLPITDESGDFQGSGLTLFEHRHHIYPAILHQGQYGRITIQHIMRQDVIQGISDIGLTIYPLH